MPLLDFLRTEEEDIELDEAQRQILLDMINNQALDVPGERGARPGDQGNFGKKLMDALLCACLPMLLSRLLQSLLSTATYSNDILEDLVRFHQTSRDNWEGQVSMIFKFGVVFFDECSKLIDVDYWERGIRWLTMGVYLGYSLSMASYIVFAFFFSFMCLVLTTTRRWGELQKLMVVVMKGDTGVF